MKDYKVHKYSTLHYKWGSGINMSGNRNASWNYDNDTIEGQNWLVKLLI